MSAETRVPAVAADDKPLPLDLSHLYSEATNLRQPSRMKQYYKFFQIPGAANLAGGMCCQTTDRRRLAC